MIAQVNYYKVGRADDIEKAGWIKVSLLGWNILVFCRDREFVALEIGENPAHDPNSLLMPDYQYAKSGSPVRIDKYLRGPSGTRWGKLQYFPIVIDNDNVFVGITR